MKDFMEKTIAKLGELEKTIDDERHSILHADHESTKKLAHIKMGLLTEIDELTQNFFKLAESKGVEPSLDGIKKMLGDYPKEDRGPLIKLFNRMRKTLSRAQEKNILNNGIIQNRLKSLDEKIDAITGRERDMTYGPSGKKGSKAINAYQQQRKA